MGNYLLWRSCRVGEERRDIKLDTWQRLHHVKESGTQVGALTLTQKSRSGILGKLRNTNLALSGKDEKSWPVGESWWENSSLTSATVGENPSDTLTQRS